MTKQITDVIRTNRDIKELLFIRITELNLRLIDVESDAQSLGRPTIRVSRLSAYFKEGDDNTGRPLTQSDVLWLCDRYGIDVKLSVTAKPKFENHRGVQHVKRKYGKEEAVEHG